jgi:plastocyanin
VWAARGTSTSTQINVLWTPPTAVDLSGATTSDLVGVYPFSYPRLSTPSNLFWVFLPLSLSLSLSLSLTFVSSLLTPPPPLQQRLISPSPQATWPVVPSLVSTSGVAPGGGMPIGNTTQVQTTTYTLTFNSQVVDTCAVNVVLDGANLPMSLSCPADVIQAALVTQYDVAVTYTPPAGAICTRPSGSRFRVGTQVVFCYTNTSYCRFRVNVTETRLSTFGGPGTIFYSFRGTPIGLTFNNGGRFARADFQQPGTLANGGPVGFVDLPCPYATLPRITLLNGALALPVGTGSLVLDVLTGDANSFVPLLSNANTVSLTSWSNVRLYVGPLATLDLVGRAAALSNTILIEGRVATDATSAVTLGHSNAAPALAFMSFQGVPVQSGTANLPFLSLTVNANSQLNFADVKPTATLLPWTLGSGAASVLTVHGTLTVQTLANVNLRDLTVSSSGTFAVDAVNSAAQTFTVAWGAANPPVTTVSVGDTVRWVWQNTAAVSLQSATSLWSAGNPANSTQTCGVFQFTFTQEGTFPYQSNTGLSSSVVVVRRQFTGVATSRSVFQVAGTIDNANILAMGRAEVSAGTLRSTSFRLQYEPYLWQCRADNIVLSGSYSFFSPMTFLGRTGPLPRTFSHDSGALTFDVSAYRGPSAWTGTTQMNFNTSIVLGGASNFSGGRLALQTTTLTLSGQARFEPLTNSIAAGAVTINGRLVLPFFVTFVAPAYALQSSFSSTSGAFVVFDDLAQSSSAWTGVNSLPYPSVSLDGTFMGGRLALNTTSLAFGSQALALFEANLLRFSTYAQAGGNVTIVRNVAMTGSCSTFSLGVNARLTLDALGYATGSWTSPAGSVMACGAVTLGTSAVFRGGLLNLSSSNLEVGSSAQLLFHALANRVALSSVSIGPSATVTLNTNTLFGPVAGDVASVFQIGSGAVVTFDQNGFYSGSDNLVGSVLPYNTLTVGGQLRAGRLTIDTQTLTINAGGNLSCVLNNSILTLNTFTVAGSFVHDRPVVINSRVGTRCTSLTVTATGSITFDALGYANNQAWTPSPISLIPCQTMQVDGRFRTGLTNLTTSSLIVGHANGLLALRPLNNGAAISAWSMTAGSVIFYAPVTVSCSNEAPCGTFSTSAGTTVILDQAGYQTGAWSDGVGSTMAQYTSVTVGGLMQAGLFTLTTPALTVSGNLSAEFHSRILRAGSVTVSGTLVHDFPLVFSTPTGAACSTMEVSGLVVLDRLGYSNNRTWSATLNSSVNCATININGGNFHVGRASIRAGQLMTGSGSNMTVDPVSSLIQATSVSFAGSVTVYKSVSLRPENITSGTSFIVTAPGVLTLDAEGYARGSYGPANFITYNAVQVDGRMLGALLSLNASGLIVNGNLTFRALNEVVMFDTLDINSNGFCAVENAVRIVPRTSCLRVQVSTSSGFLQFDQFGNNANRTWTSALGSNITCTSLTVNGQFQGGRLTATVSTFTIGPSGQMTAEMLNNIFVAHTVSISNRLTLFTHTSFRSPITSSGGNRFDVLGSSAVVVLDANGYSNGGWSGNSSLWFDNFLIEGSMRAGSMAMETTLLTVSGTGNLSFFATLGVLTVDTVSVRGTLLVANPITIRPRGARCLDFSVLDSGFVMLDQAGHQRGNLSWSSATLPSAMRFDSMLIAANAQLWGGLLDLTVGQIEVRGHFRYDNFNFASQVSVWLVSGNVTIARTANLYLNPTGSGTNLTITSSGNFIVDATGYARGSWTPTTFTNFNYVWVLVAGSLQVGLANVEADELTITSSGRMLLDCFQQFATTNMTVSGSFIANRTVLFSRDLVFPLYSTVNSIFVTAGGLVRLDAQAYNSNSNWSSILPSFIPANSIVVSGSMFGGYLQLDVSWLTVNNVLHLDSQALDLSADDIAVNTGGNMTVARNARINGLSTANTQQITVAVGGLLTLDQAGYQRDSLWSDATGSQISALRFDINGTFNAGFVTIDNSTLMRVGSAGTWNFDPAGNINITIIRSDGIVNARNGVRFPVTSLLNINAGVFTLDTVDQARRNWSTTIPSTFGLAMPTFDINVSGGSFLGGSLEVVANSVTVAGRMLFEAANLVARMDTLTILPNGLVDIYKQANLRSKNGMQLSSIFIDVNGLLIIDSEGYSNGRNWTGTNCTPPCTNGSSISSGSIVVNGQLRGGFLVLTISQLDLLIVGPGAVVEMQPLRFINITTAIVSGTVLFYTPTQRNSTWFGTNLTVNQGGLIELGRAGPRDATGSGAGISYLQITRVRVAGVINAGSFVALVDSLIVDPTGRIDTSGSGHFSGEGPGAGINSASGASGASYGGRGGFGAGAVAGAPYGAIFYPGLFNQVPLESMLPSRWGSGGGVGSGPGGRGGGYIHMHVRVLTHNGQLQANAAPTPTGSGGGGSGGAVFIAADQFSGVGTIQVIGGDAVAAGAGGGAGGLVVVNYNSGSFQSQNVLAYGGSTPSTLSGENGGPGVVYLVGGGFRNLRMDNAGRRSLIQRANDAASARTRGAAGYLLPPALSFVYNFDIIELYGEAHLLCPTDADFLTIRTTFLVGDQTSVFHVLPGQTLDVIEQSTFKRVNISVWPLVYTGATYRLPNASIEWRPTFPGLTVSPTITIYGFADMSRAHLIISLNGVWVFDTVSNRSLTCTGLTVQDGGIFRFNNVRDVESDWFFLRVVPDPVVPTRNGALTIEGGGLMTLGLANISANWFSIDLSGTLTLSGMGFANNGPGSPRNTGGASHGGVGGYVRTSLPSDAGAVYGDVYTPNRFGSGVGSNRGGGLLVLSVTNTFRVDGSLLTEGQTSSSGGSLWITANALDGMGVISANGGPPQTSASGSGGRIAVYYFTQANFRGRFTAFGGAGVLSDSQTGSCGTVYMAYTGSSYSNRSLILNNNGQIPPNDEPICVNCTDPGRAWLNTVPQSFDEIHLYGQASLAMMPWLTRPAFFFNAGKLLSDGTGVINVLANQLLIFQDADYNNVDVSVYVQAGGRIQLPETFVCRGHTLLIRGELAGVQDLTVDSGCTLLLSPTAFTTNSTQGSFAFRTLNVRNGGEIKQVVEPNARDWTFQFTITNLFVRGGALMHFVKMNINAVNISVEDGGQLYCDTFSNSCPNTAGMGFNFWGASGAGHGGTGGAGANAAIVGQAFGNTMLPTATGCSGGNYTTQIGGYGGGALRMNVSGTLSVDGLVHANGANGVSSSGGGSGGSVLIFANRLTGYGSIQSLGGAGGTDANYPGGGGAGGRIAVYFQLNQTYMGTFQTFGGLGRLGAIRSSSTGGAGTVFLYAMATRERRLLVDGGLNPAFLPVIGSRIVNFSNMLVEPGRTVVIPVGEDAFGNSTYWFHRTFLLGYAHLIFLPPSLPFVLEVPRITGDRLGTLHVAPQQTFIMAKDSELHQVSYNVIVYSGGLIRMPPVIDVYRASIWMEGRLSQTQNLTFHHGGAFFALPGGGTLVPNIADTYTWNVLRVQDGSSVNFNLINPIVNNGMVLITQQTFIEGGGVILAKRITFQTVNLTIDAGGLLSADGQGYGPLDPVGFVGVAGLVNGGVGVSGAGASGGGFGGSGGRGAGQNRIGFAYGDFYEPTLLGSAGGNGTTGQGGRGAGSIWLNVTHTLYLDGEVTADGAPGGGVDAGGGSGGAVWVYCNLIKGFGNISANGGAGARDLNQLNMAGGGGAGGRVAVYFNYNRTGWAFLFQAYGGSGFEAGGPGTIFIYNQLEDHRTLIINNNGQGPLTRLNYLFRPVTAIDFVDSNGVQRNYSLASLQTDSCRAWLLPISGGHFFAASNFSFHFEELQIGGNGHLAVLGDFNRSNVADIYFTAMIGDRTGVVHVGGNQTMDLTRDEIDLPFSLWAYANSYTALAPYLMLNSVFVQMSGVLANVQNITLVNLAHFYANNLGRTLGLPANQYYFDFVRVQDKGTFHMETDPVIDRGINLTAIAILIQGGGVMQGTRVFIVATNITVDDGGSLDANGLGYHYRHGTNRTGLNGPVNVGKGFDSIFGGSGAGHGGSGGCSKNQSLVGLAYGDMFEPWLLGSCGGSGPTIDRDHGARGGGSLNITVNNTLQVDGLLSADGTAAFLSYGGGGSGGSLYITTQLLKGFGMITARGGRGHEHVLYGGGGGAGGRIVVNFNVNDTAWDFKHLASGGNSSTEAGGPGTVFVYNIPQKHRTIIIDNLYQEPLWRLNYLRLRTSAITYIDTQDRQRDYNNISEVGCRAWIMPESYTHFHAGGNGTFFFHEIQMYGNGHLAILTTPVTRATTLFFNFMIGDRTGTLHLGNNQTCDLRRPKMDLPFNVWVYPNAFLGMGYSTEVFGVFVQCWGTVAGVENMTIFSDGEFWGQPRRPHTGPARWHLPLQHADYWGPRPVQHDQ